MAELKPCPCCGGKARMKHGKYNLLGAYGTAELDRKWFGVYCTACEMSQPRRRYDSKEEAIEAWNKRTEPERQKGRWKWNGKHWECTNCRNERLHDLVLGLDAAYCPRCGADMKGESE